MPPAMPMIKDGKLRALAVSAKHRAAVLPEVPTMEEAGLKDQEADTFQAVLVPPARRRRSWRCSIARSSRS